MKPYQIINDTVESVCRALNVTNTEIFYEFNFRTESENFLSTDVSLRLAKVLNENPKTLQAVLLKKIQASNIAVQPALNVNFLNFPLVIDSVSAAEIFAPWTIREANISVLVPPRTSEISELNYLKILAQVDYFVHLRQLARLKTEILLPDKNLLANSDSLFSDQQSLLKMLSKAVSEKEAFVALQAVQDNAGLANSVLFLSSRHFSRGFFNKNLPAVLRKVVALNVIPHIPALLEEEYLNSSYIQKLLANKNISALAFYLIGLEDEQDCDLEACFLPSHQDLKFFCEQTLKRILLVVGEESLKDVNARIALNNLPTALSASLLKMPVSLTNAINRNAGAQILVKNIRELLGEFNKWFNQPKIRQELANSANMQDLEMLKIITGFNALFLSILKLLDFKFN